MTRNRRGKLCRATAKHKTVELVEGEERGNLCTVREEGKFHENRGKGQRQETKTHNTH